MNLSLDIIGTMQLRKRMVELESLAKGSRLIRKGMGNAGRLIHQAQKARAPVRQARISVRKTRELIAKGRSLTAARKGASRVQKKFRKNGDEIKPGLLKRSLGYRIRKKDGLYQVVIGANVGKKRDNPNYAPHSVLQGGTKVRKTKAGANRGRTYPNLYIKAGLHAASGAALKALEAGVKEGLFVGELVRT